MAVDPLPKDSLLSLEPHRPARYRIVSALSAGGFGITYRALDTWFEDSTLSSGVIIKELACEDLVHREPGAVKIVPNSMDTQPGHERLVHEFFREARLLLRLRNRHVVQVIDSWAENGTAYYAMLELEGARPLGSTPVLGSPPAPALSWFDAEQIAMQLLDGLDAIHRGNVLHLDMKPENVLLCRDGRVVLIDFGTARRKEQVATAPTRLSGVSLFYAAKELLDPFFSPTMTATGSHIALPKAHEIGPWTDLYSWALIVVGLIRAHPTHQPWVRCYGAPDPYAVNVLDLTSAGVPDTWAHALHQCLAIDTGERRKTVPSVPHVRALIRGTPSIKSEPLPPWTSVLESGREITVCGHGTGDFQTIADAVEAASPNSRIVIRPGTYREAVVLRKAVMLEGRDQSGKECRDDVIVESSDAHAVIAHTHVLIRGMTLKSHSDVRGLAVIGAAGSLVIEGCRLSGVGEVAGIWAKRDCTIRDTEIESAVTGVDFSGPSMLIEDCKIQGRVGFISRNPRSASNVRNVVIRSQSSAFISFVNPRLVMESCTILCGGCLWGGDLVMKKCRILVSLGFDCKSLTTLEDCLIELNGKYQCFIHVEHWAELVLRDCIVRGSPGHPVFVEGTALIERCDLRDNKAKVKCAPGGRISASGNVE